MEFDNEFEKSLWYWIKRNPEFRPIDLYNAVLHKFVPKYSQQYLEKILWAFLKRLTSKKLAYLTCEPSGDKWASIYKHNFKIDKCRICAGNYLFTTPFVDIQVDVSKFYEGVYRGWWRTEFGLKWRSDPTETLVNAEAIAKAYLLGFYDASLGREISCYSDIFEYQKAYDSGKSVWISKQSQEGKCLE